MKSEEELAPLRVELAALNAEVTAVLAKRKAWMDGHMADFAKVQVGEDIYNLDTGGRLGTVTKLYRYWDSQRNPLYDTMMDTNYEYHTGGNCFDNTSRQTYVRVGTKKDLEELRSERTKSVYFDGNWESVFKGQR